MTVVFTRPVAVPEQKLSAHVACRPERARRGKRITATLHNETTAELFTGVEFQLEHHDGKR